MALGSKDANKKLGVIYSPFHGTGGRMVPKLLQLRNFERLKTVSEQMVPTVIFPHYLPRILKIQKPLDWLWRRQMMMMT